MSKYNEDYNDFVTDEDIYHNSNDFEVCGKEKIQNSQRDTSPIKDRDTIEYAKPYEMTKTSIRQIGTIFIFTIHNLHLIEEKVQNGAVKRDNSEYFKVSSK